MFVKIGKENVSVDAIVSTSVQRFVDYAPDDAGDDARDEVWYLVVVTLNNGKKIYESKHRTEKDANKALDAFNRAAAATRKS